MTLMAWLYWRHYVSSLLLSCWQCASALLSRTTSEGPKEDTSAPLRRLYTFTRPYVWRFAAVLLLVILSSYGKTDRTVCQLFDSGLLWVKGQVGFIDCMGKYAQLRKAKEAF